ncbi:MAG: hypothetical protein ACO20H_04535 [Bacteriovoracaceae bacterium]
MQLKKLFLTGQYDQAVEFITNSSFYRDKESLLLSYLEKGIILHTQGQYQKSVSELEKAKTHYRKLYTESLSDKIQTLISNDNYDFYYGSAYERSLINFYNALNYYLLYQKSGDRKFLFKSRAEVLDWDSFQNMRLEAEKGNSVFKTDLLSKVFGPIIHEEIGTKQEIQIAKILYKDSHKTLFRYYNAYPSYNEKYKEFKRDYSDLSKLTASVVESKYIKETPVQKEIKSFVNSQIKRIKKGKKNNVIISFQKGIIPQKEAKQEYYNLEKALRANSDSPTAKAFSRLGSQVLMIFAADKLGLIPPPSQYNPIGTHLGIQLAAVSAEGIAISFELPQIKAKPIKESSFITFKKVGFEKTIPLTLINSLGDIAEEAVFENSLSRYFRLGVRLSTKHLGAILAAFTTYQSSKASLGEGMAKVAALAQYAATLEFIKSSEKADTRQWSLLPEQILLSQTDLPEGEYETEFIVKDENGQVLRKLPLGTKNISKEKQLLNFRVL